MLRVIQISFYADPAGRAPAELLSAWRTVVDTAQCAAAAGVAVTVIQAAAYRSSLQLEGISYHFLPCDAVERDARQREELRTLLRQLAPEVLHVQGLGFPRQVSSLAALLPQVPIILQDHAGAVPRWWRRGPLRRAGRRIAAVAFCAQAQADPFLAAGMFGPAVKVYEIPENTSRFMPGQQAAARAATGVSGDPLLLWVGHLNDNKDPLVVLDGIARIVGHLPGLTLCCCYASAPLLEAVQRRVASDSRLHGCVHLLGPVSHEQVERLMQAADLFVLGSHREGSGYSLIEALACGTSPAVTDIPSFRALTADGSVGRLWSCGDAAGLATAILDLAARDLATERARVRAHFDAELSFAAVGRKLAQMYTEVHAHA